MCGIHAEAYKKKQLKLSTKEYPEELSAPIDIDKNTEMQFFSQLGSEDLVKQMLTKRRFNFDMSRSSLS